MVDGSSDDAKWTSGVVGRDKWFIKTRKSWSVRLEELLHALLWTIWWREAESSFSFVHQIREFSLPGQPPVGDSAWFKAVYRWFALSLYLSFFYIFTFGFLFLFFLKFLVLTIFWFWWYIISQSRSVLDDTAFAQLLPERFHFSHYYSKIIWFKTNLFSPYLRSGVLTQAIFLGSSLLRWDRSRTPLKNERENHFHNLLTRSLDLRVQNLCRWFSHKVRIFEYFCTIQHETHESNLMYRDLKLLCCFG